MGDIIKASDNTPIEIALGIGEDGMTTAKCLFDFLEMNPANYARWIRRNITNNEFAEENVDYFSLPVDSEYAENENSSDRKSLTGRGNTEDYKLSSAFAKKLSMQGKTEKAEQARNYFISVEDKAKDMVLLLKQASNNPMEMLKLHYAALEQVDKKVDKVDNRITALDKKLESELLNLPLLPTEADKVDRALKSRGAEVVGGKESNAYHDKGLLRRVYWDIHGQLRREFGVSTYKGIKRNQVDLALKFLAGYHPPLALQGEIDTANSQISLPLEGGAC